jgi:hypothetical protein
MRFVRLIPIILLAIAVLAVLAFSSGDTAVAQGNNLLVNPSFEGQYNSYVPETPQEVADCPLGVCTTAQMPAGWKPWWVKERPTDVNPEYKPAEFSHRVRSGSRASQYFSFWTTHKAGLRQTVNVPENATVTFSVWGFAWMTESDEPGAGSDGRATPNMRVGIDPTGGTNPYSPAVVWSGFQQARDIYTLFSVEVQAQGSQVTVFTFSAPDVNPDSTEYGFKHTDIYWDDASLTTAGGAAAPPPPAANPGAGTTGDTQVAPAAGNPNPNLLPPTSTPNAEGVIYSVVQAGDSIWSIAAKAGITLDEILELNNLTKDDFVKVGDLLIVGHGDPPGIVEEEPEVIEEEQPAAEPTATPEAVPAAAVETTLVEEKQPSASICLSAYDDANQNGARDEGEPLRSAVAFTISDVEKVVSNYVTDGASEPFCIEGLAPGNYQITRSIANGEIATSTNDQSVSLQDGEATTLEFGSYEDADAVAALQSSNLGTGNNLALAGSALDAEGGEGGSGIFIAAVVVAVLLLVGVLVIILSARRTTA